MKRTFYCLKNAMSGIFTLNRINFLILVLLAALSITVGVADFHWSQFFSQPEQMQVLLVSRLPRTFAVILVGATLGVAGMVLQIVLKNRFIEPSMIGASGIGDFINQPIISKRRLASQNVRRHRLRTHRYGDFYLIVTAIAATSTSHGAVGRDCVRQYY